LAGKFFWQELLKKTQLKFAFKLFCFPLTTLKGVKSESFFICFFRQTQVQRIPKDFFVSKADEEESVFGT
jgi:hypothetical protein